MMTTPNIKEMRWFCFPVMGTRGKGTRGFTVYTHRILQNKDTEMVTYVQACFHHVSYDAFLKPPRLSTSSEEWVTLTSSEG